MISIIVNLLVLLVSLTLGAITKSATLYMISVLIFLSVVAAIFQQRRNRASIDSEIRSRDARVQVLEAELHARQEKYDDLSVELQQKQKIIDESNGTLNDVAAAVQIFEGSIPVIDALTKRVVERTESSNLNLSDKIFSIAEQSKRLGNEIQEVLQDLLGGDSGLEREVVDLQAEIDRFQHLISDMDTISSHYLRDMEVIKEAVDRIGSFTASLTDLADQTNLLSITASIEAARAGNAGSGFRIIASEVQGLAHRSKSIAEEINSSIVSAAAAVENSFDEQKETLGKGIDEIRKSRESLSRISGNLPAKIQRIGTTVEESRSISGGVTEDLNGIIVTLQYHDIIRQILEHCVAILGEVNTVCRQSSSIQDFRQLPLDSEDIEERVRTLATKFFTVDDEWDVLGISVRDTSALQERESFKQQHKLEGDITLF